jgi:hypothetical protein
MTALDLSGDEQLSSSFEPCLNMGKQSKKLYDYDKLIAESDGLYNQ